MAKEKRIKLVQLRDEDFVLFPSGYILHKVAVDACKSVGFAPRITSEGEDMDAIKGLVAAGIGVSVLPESAFYDSTPRFTVKIPIDTPDFRRSVGIISPANRELAPSELVFFNFITL